MGVLTGVGGSPLGKLKLLSERRQYIWYYNDRYREMLDSKLHHTD